MGMEVAREIHRLTGEFPKSELYGLTSQMRRASVAIPSNIAEGFVRRSRREMIRFTAIAHGSLAELETQITLAKDFGYVAPQDHDALLETLDHLGRKMTRFIQNMAKP